MDNENLEKWREFFDSNKKLLEAKGKMQKPFMVFNNKFLKVKEGWKIHVSATFLIMHLF